MRSPRNHKLELLDNLAIEEDGLPGSILNHVYSLSHKTRGMIAVYDIDQLEPQILHAEEVSVTDLAPPYYQFKDPDNKIAALVAVVEVEL